MSFISIIRDYVEMLNYASDYFGHDFSLSLCFFASLGYILQTLKIFVIYILSFQWIRNFAVLPTIIPVISNSIFRETFFLEIPSKILFEFLEIPSLGSNKLFLGVLNSFFFTLPTSVVHLISVRRLLIQGIPAGVFSISGYLLGQFLFLICVLFGIRFVLVPWFTFEYLSYIVGLILIFRMVYRMVREPLIAIPGWDFKYSKYRKFFITSFVLAWCEQTSILPYLGNLSITSNPTLLEGFSGANFIISLVSHANYLIGIFTGSILFTILWGAFFLKCRNLIFFYGPLLKSSFIQLLNTATFVIALGLSLSSIPYYSLDYLFTGPLGFVSKDKSFTNTIFDTYNIKDRSRCLGINGGFKSLDIDVSLFDRGRYMLFPKSLAYNFEELNYQGEAAWSNAQDKLSMIRKKKVHRFSLKELFKIKKVSPSKFDIFEKFETLNKRLPNKKLAEDTKFNRRVQDWYDLNLEITGDDDNARIDLFNHFIKSSFPLEFLRVEPIAQVDLERKIKNNYYTNPIYKNLLTVDIDFFLNRQPTKFKLSHKQEVDLVNKRRALNFYFNSLGAYSKLPYNEDFEMFFESSKSFSNKVYNQQFKGTLKSLRRLFALTTVAGSESSQVLKFDQPLYNISKGEPFSPYHEELVDSIIENLKLNRTDTKNSSFSNFMLTQPLYAGWDENLRKFVITNKLMPRTTVGYEMNLNPELCKKFISESQTHHDKTKIRPLDLQDIEFTVWPITKELLGKPKKELKIPYVTLFSAKKDSNDSFNFDTFSTLPSNWESLHRAETTSKKFYNFFDYLAPRRGGFIWPGNRAIPNLLSLIPSKFQNISSLFNQNKE